MRTPSRAWRRGGFSPGGPTRWWGSENFSWGTPYAWGIGRTLIWPFTSNLGSSLRQRLTPRGANGKEGVYHWGLKAPPVAALTLKTRMDCEKGWLCHSYSLKYEKLKLSKMGLTGTRLPLICVNPESSPGPPPRVQPHVTPQPAPNQPQVRPFWAFWGL